MRVGLIWPDCARLTAISVRYERYVRGLRRLGHEPVTVCLPPAAAGYAEPVVLAANDATMRAPAFYRELKLDAAFVMTWLVFPDLVTAIRQACPWLVSIADSDGLIGVRVHPRRVFARMIGQHGRWDRKLRAAKYWLQLYLTGTASQDQPVLASATDADRIAVCSPAAADHLRAFFAHYRRPELAERVIAVPYPINDCYRTGPVAAERPARVVAIGRWDDPQKDAPLLAATVDAYRRAGGRAEVCLFGPNGANWFQPLVRSWPGVRYAGVQPPEVIAACLRSSRALLLPSRWESGPIVLNEALASGCTVVGTDAVPAVVSACRGGYGTLAAGRSAGRLAAAWAAEMSAWDRGERDPVRIAAHWRPLCDPVHVCAQMLPAGAGGQTSERTGPPAVRHVGGGHLGKRH